MNILITGTSGLVGSAAAELLAGEGHAVVGYDRSLPREPAPGCVYEQGDLCDFPRLFAVMQKHRIDQAVHCGGLSHPYAGTDSPNQLVQTNIVGTTNVFEASRLLGVRKVVYLSSGAVYGNSDAATMKETDALYPTTVYAVTKLTGENLANVYASEYGMDMVSLRLSSVYGPRCFMPDAVKDILEYAARGQDVAWDRGADQQLEFLYVKDAAYAVACALKAEGLTRRVFNIGSGVNRTVREVADIIAGLYPNVRIDIGPGPMGFDFLGAFDCSAARDHLGFEPRYSLEEGIRDYALYLQSH
jgi:UDP-glucose 4-epimerase